MRITTALAAFFLLTPAALALSVESAPVLPGLPEPPPGVTGWDTLGKASVLFGEEAGQETVTTLIPPEIEALDGTAVKLMGFMFPIDAEPELSRFLLVEYPADCPFCLAGTVEPSRMVEVEVGQPIRWQDEAVILAGRLEIVREDADGLVYRLREAKLSR